MQIYEILITKQQNEVELQIQAVDVIMNIIVRHVAVELLE